MASFLVIIDTHLPIPEQLAYTVYRDGAYIGDSINLINTITVNPTDSVFFIAVNMAKEGDFKNTVSITSVVPVVGENLFEGPIASVLSSQNIFAGIISTTALDQAAQYMIMGYRNENPGDVWWIDPKISVVAPK